VFCENIAFVWLLPLKNQGYNNNSSSSSSSNNSNINSNNNNNYYYYYYYCYCYQYYYYCILISLWQALSCPCGTQKFNVLSTTQYPGYFAHMH